MGTQRPQESNKDSSKVLLSKFKIPNGSQVAFFGEGGEDLSVPSAGTVSNALVSIGSCNRGSELGDPFPILTALLPVARKGG
jgi:hypothetical protein